MSDSLCLVLGAHGKEQPTAPSYPLTVMCVCMCAHTLTHIHDDDGNKSPCLCLLYKRIQGLIYLELQPVTETNSTKDPCVCDRLCQT